MSRDFDVTARYLMPTGDGKHDTAAMSVRVDASDAIEARNFIARVLQEQGFEAQTIDVEPAPAPRRPADA